MSDTPILEIFYLVILKKGDQWSPEVTPEVMEIQKRHLAHLSHLAEQGKLLIAGPFIDGPDDKRGLSIIAADSMEEAVALTEADPAVQAGRLKVEVIRWGVEKGFLKKLLNTDSP